MDSGRLDGSISKSKGWEASSRVPIMIEAVTIFLLLRSYSNHDTATFFGNLSIEHLFSHLADALIQSKHESLLLLGTVEPIKRADNDAQLGTCLYYLTTQHTCNIPCALIHCLTTIHSVYPRCVSR